MNNLLEYNNNFLSLNEDDLSIINGGLALTIAGITFVGWKAAVLIGAGVTTLTGAAAALGLWNGYFDTRK